MRLINADKITKDSELITAISDLLENCHAKHKDNCFAPDCKNCLARFFSENYNHLLKPLDLQTIDETDENL